MKTRSDHLAALTLSMLLVVLAAAPFSAAEQPGEALYKSKCVSCHGADGKGASPAGKALKAHDFSSDEVQKMSDAELTEVVSSGKNKMPAYGKTLKPGEIKDLVAYVRALGKK